MMRIKYLRALVSVPENPALSPLPKPDSDELPPSEPDSGEISPNGSADPPNPDSPL